MPNKQMDRDEDVWIVNYFKPFFNKITYYSWLREPDFCNDYRERWNKDNQISVNSKPERFELASFWRLVRDPDYVLFLKEVGVKRVQLTYFGMEEMTDKYVGRKGAFQELLKAMTDAWKVGNLKNTKPEEMIRKIIEEDTDALNAAKTITIKTLVERYGNMHSKRTFFIEDYKSYLLNCFLEE